MLKGDVGLYNIFVESVQRLQTKHGRKYVLVGFDNGSKAYFFTDSFHYRGYGMGVEIYGDLEKVSVEYNNILKEWNVRVEYSTFDVRMKVKSKTMAKELISSINRLLTYKRR